MRPLEGRVAVVTGSSRGVGRGIACVLGEAGATVYVTGRSTRQKATRPDLSGTTVEDTAEMVSEHGGVGVPVRVDHTVDAEVEALFEQVAKEQGKLDLLVNNAWGGYEGLMDGTFDAPFWEQPLTRFDKMFTAGVRSHLVTTRAALPLLMAERSGLVVNTSGRAKLIVNTTLEMDTSFYDQALFYRTSKVTINYMTFGMAHDLRKSGFNIAVVGLAPGWTRTEEVMANFEKGVHEPEELEQTESAEHVGRAVMALATDPGVMSKTGQTLRTRDVALEYGFTDVDGRQPS